MVKVTNAVPIPTDHPSLLYPWKTMKIGESFWVESMTFKYQCRNAGLRYGRKFRCRAEKQNGKWGMRVWRVE